jgi:hypothetical protein
VQGDDVGDDGKSQSGTTEVAGAGVVQTGEPLEDAGAVFCGHAGPVVIDA